MPRRRTLSLRSISSLAALSLAAANLSGCILVPEAGPLLGHDVKKRLFDDIVRGVQCEIRHAVLEQIYKDRDHWWGERKFKWLEDWAAKMTLNLTVDDMTGFHPGVDLLTPNMPFAHVWRAPDQFRDRTTPELVAQKYQFSAGGGLDLEARRLDSVAFGYDFSVFVNGPPEDVNAPCYHFGGITIGGDLQLKAWLDDVLEPVKQCAFLGRDLPETAEEETDPLRMFRGIEPVPKWCREKDLSRNPKAEAAPILDFSHQVTFIITFDVNATPQWNLVRISTSAAKLLDVSRKDTGDLIITLGPRDKSAPGNKVMIGGMPISSGLSPEASRHHEALVFGAAVRN